MRGFPLDLTNQRFGRLVAIKKTNKRKNLSPLWLCQCDCGKKTLAAANPLTKGNKKSCGCLKDEWEKNSGINLSVGKRFGRLLVLKRDPDDIRRVICKCDCGAIKSTRYCVIEQGTRSCGCLAAELASKRSKTHGLSKTRIYHCWSGIFRRCYKENDISYKNYGSRGIRVCKRWHKFENFYADMGNPPSLKHSIDRIDVNGNYEPSNCRWATQKEQGNNTRVNRRIKLNGTTLTLSQWSERLNIDRTTISKRIDKYKWSKTKALTTPVKYYQANKSRFSTAHS